MTLVTLGAPLAYERDAFFHNLFGLGTGFYAFGLVLFITHIPLSTPFTYECNAFFYNPLGISARFCVFGLGTEFYAFALVLLVTHVSLRATLLIRLKSNN